MESDADPDPDYQDIVEHNNNSLSNHFNFNNSMPPNLVNNHPHSQSAPMLHQLQLTGLESRSVSPTSGKAASSSSKPRGRRPKAAVFGGVGAAAPSTSSNANPSISTNNPVKDTDSYTKQRKENHKNVEKKRRETINDGIKRLANLVPNPDKNKSRIINQAADYIERILEEGRGQRERATGERVALEKEVRELREEVEGLRRMLGSQQHGGSGHPMAGNGNGM